AQAQRYLDTVGLFVALGGSWEQRGPAGQSRRPATAEKKPGAEISCARCATPAALRRERSGG
ncbi:MAG: hypothetical protein KGJ12_04090, partial [Gammaproteobacteria bacterium]|nr:hypothetical protein [Gammaproteobacteria bacterium]